MDVARIYIQRKYEAGSNQGAIPTWRSASSNSGDQVLGWNVNIPGIRTALSCTSTTKSPRVYSASGACTKESKQTAHKVIYDFMALPRPLDSVSSLTTEQAQRDLTMHEEWTGKDKEFGRLSQNSMDANNLIRDIQEAHILYRRRIGGRWFRVWNRLRQREGFVELTNAYHPSKSRISKQGLWQSADGRMD